MRQSITQLQNLQLPTDNSMIFYCLALFYFDGETSSDYEASVLYLRLLLETSSTPFPPAQHLLGVCYNSGKGVTRKFEKANELFTLAAQAGHADSMNSLGYNYQDGSGFREADIKAANNYYEQAAQLGNAEAMANLGFNYENGLGKEANIKKANVHYLRACKLHNKDALFNMADNYYQARGGERNESEAERYWLLSSQLGHPQASFDMAKYLHDTKKNLMEVNKYLDLALQQATSADLISEIVAARASYNASTGSPQSPDLRSGNNINTSKEETTSKKKHTKK